MLPTPVLLTFALATAIVSFLFPIQTSIGAVFLLAGPHNWMEARYALSRFPRRAGALFPFLTISLAGVFALPAGFAILPFAAKYWGWSYALFAGVIRLWNVLLIGWAGTLFALRRHQGPCRRWPFLMPILLSALAVGWYFPYHFGLLLVFVHPLLSFVFLDREIARHRPRWLQGYRRTLAVSGALSLPVLAAVAFLPSLNLSDPLSLAIGYHSGTLLYPTASARLLIGCHSYLELLHFGIWCLAMPMISIGVPFTLRGIPLASRGPVARRLITVLLGMLGLVVLALWISFPISYLATRRVYFTIALVHVLGEVPLLLRLL